MSKPPIKYELAAWLVQAISASGASLDIAAAANSLEPPKDEKFGDLSTAVMLRLAKESKKPPRALADTIAKQLSGSLSGSSLKGRIEKVSVEGPGFLNFYYSSAEIASVLLKIQTEGDNFGRPQLSSSAEGGSASGGKKILLEFVSANPTGPLTVAHGRQAALGDSLARILRFCGHAVTTEYYNNDEGVQINTLGKSLQSRLEQVRTGQAAQMPENYYQGDYLVAIAGDLAKRSPTADLETCRLFARDTIMKGILRDLADFDVKFDNVYSQEALGKSGKVEKTLEELQKKGKVFENEGALWLRSTEYGDDKDRVLVKSDKTYTYLTPDIAYHHEKFVRGFEEIIDILGPDHHGYIARLKASQAALGHDPERVRILIAQLVTLYEGKKQVRMSTRAGEFVTLRQILDEVGRDAGRFFFVMRKFDAHLDFDLALAKTQTPDNPAFYIQYAHARIESIKNTHKNNAVGAGLVPAQGRPQGSPLQRLVHPTEIKLMRLLWQYEDALAGAEKTLEPYRLVPYLIDLAAGFHRFYAENRVVTEDEGLTAARLTLVEGVQKVLKSGLGLLGVSAPLKM